MSLHATVYCDCFERGRLRTPPRPEWKVYLDESGARFPGTDRLEEKIAFDQWTWDACEHENGWLANHRLGNIAFIGWLRKVLDPHQDRLPVLREKVIYSGSHCCDWLTVPDVEQLGKELQALAQIHVPDPVREEWLREFESQLRDLVECALRVHKPIVF